jgi:glycolate oxidase FAD binding subunit
MMRLEPHTVDDLCAQLPTLDEVRVRGGGTKSEAPAARHGLLDVRHLRGITEYSADECVLTALGGTPLADIDRLLQSHGQYLPFDPPLVGAGATLGGTVASGVSGSGRYRYGGVRDFVIGARVVDGEGRIIRSGGKVVKNAAGFLLHHGMVGSQGRYGVLAELTLKVFPRPEARATLRVDTGSVEAAMRLARSPEIRRADLEAVDFDHAGILWLRAAGRAVALSARLERLRWEVGGDMLDAADDEGVWDDAREFVWAGSSAVLKVPLPVGHSLAMPAIAARYTCAGTCAWLAVDDVVAAAERLSTIHLQGLVVRGPHAGARVGIVATNAFEEHVRRVLDPRGRFRAAPDPRR